MFDVDIPNLKQKNMSTIYVRPSESWATTKIRNNIFALSATLTTGGIGHVIHIFAPPLVHCHPRLYVHYKTFKKRVTIRIFLLDTFLLKLAARLALPLPLLFPLLVPLACWGNSLICSVRATAQWNLSSNMDIWKCLITSPEIRKICAYGTRTRICNTSIGLYHQWTEVTLRHFVWLKI